MAVILYIAMSVDGFIAKKDGSVDWLVKYNEGGEDYGYKEFYKGIGASIMGAATYLKGVEDGWIDPKMPTYVVTHRELERPPGAEIRFYSGDLRKLVGEVGKTTKKDIWLVGGGKLAQGFLRERLVDRIILSVIPEMLGEGIPLFGETGQGGKLRLADTKSYKSGIVQMSYEVD